MSISEVYQCRLLLALPDCCNEVCHLRCSLLRHLLLALMDCSDECSSLLLSISYELINCSCESNLYCSHDIIPYPALHLNVSFGWSTCSVVGTVPILWATFVSFRLH